MIIESICNLIYKLLTTLLSFINIPEFDSEFISSFTTILDMLLVNSKSIIGLFVPWQIVRAGFALVVVLVAIRYGYPLVMWILRKIPMLGIS